MQRLSPTLGLGLLLLIAGCDDPADDVPTATIHEPSASAEGESEPAGDGDGDEAAAGDADDAVAEPEPGSPPTGALAIDTGRSTFEFVGSKVTDSHTGHFNQWSGWIALQEPFEQSSVGIEIQMASVEADNARLTGHLRTDDFFDVANHATASFVTTSLAPAPADAEGATHLVTGRLTLRGQTQTITFPLNAEVSEGEVRARAEFSIDRQRWGINYPGMEDDLIRDQVVIRFDVRAPRTAG